MTTFEQRFDVQLKMAMWNTASLWAPLYGTSGLFEAIFLKDDYGLRERLRRLDLRAR
jgi:hypothetical protein